MSITNDEEVTALRLIIAMLIIDLDRTGAVSKTDFAARLRSYAAQAEQEGLPGARGEHRPGLRICRQIADSIDPPDNNSGTEGWIPVVYRTPEK